MLQWLGRDVHPLNVTACEYAPLPDWHTHWDPLGAFASLKYIFLTQTATLSGTRWLMVEG
jgi:hypothetical protein